jgi:hypothetical protein
MVTQRLSIKEAVEERREKGSASEEAVLIAYLEAFIPAVITYVFPPLLLQGSWPSGIGNRSAQGR